MTKASQTGLSLTQSAFDIAAIPANRPTATIIAHQQRLIREAYRRGLSSWVSPSPDQIMPTSLRMRLGGLVGAMVITVLTFTGLLYLISAAI
jgi:hypothetical protein